MDPASNILSTAEISLVDHSSPRATFLATYRRQQEWSFPDSLIYYIIKNPSSPNCYEKMIQSCKHFFIKNPILIVPEFSLEYRKSRWDAQLQGRHVDLKKLASKIWVEYGIDIWNDNLTDAHILSPITPIFYRSDIKGLFLNEQNIYFDDLKFLALVCKKIRFTTVIVMNKTGAVMQLEDIIQAFPKCEDFDYNFDYISDRASEIVSSKTVKELLNIPHFLKFTDFTLCDIPETFDIDAFYDYIKKNKNTKINLSFNKQISDRFQARLQAIVDEIVADDNREYIVPLIVFSDMTTASHEKMFKLRKHR